MSVEACGVQAMATLPTSTAAAKSSTPSASLLTPSPLANAEPPRPDQTPADNDLTNTFVTPPVESRNATTGPDVAFMRTALSAGVSETAPPSATQAPCPPLAEASYFLTLIWPPPAPVGNSVQATMTLPSAASAMLGRREGVAVLLMPPSLAEPASCC